MACPPRRNVIGTGTFTLQRNVSALLLLLLVCFCCVNARPLADDMAEADTLETRQHGSYWLADIKRQGKVPFGKDADFQVFRNVRDFGAKGDGVSDDTDAINKAISTGGRCGKGCDSSTTTPAIVYFPPGTYLVTKPIIQYYYTQLIGDAVSLPTIRGDPSFKGMALIDADPYDDQGVNWYTNQNNFFRQIRNLVIDLTKMPMSAGAGIHWQVAQATSLQNIVFNMAQGGGAANKQIGIFMDNGSGGFMADLVFNGGNYGAFFGSQQFTTRNLTFSHCNTAIYMNWNWLWALKSVAIDSCGIGIDMSNGPDNQTVGSVLLQDSKLTNTPVGIKTAWSDVSIPPAGGVLLLDNVDFTGCRVAVQSHANATILAGGSVVASWAQGRQYVGKVGTRAQQTLPAPHKPAPLLDAHGRFFERSKPQYESVPASDFVSVKAAGAKGDGRTDDTAAIQAAMDAIKPDQVLYFDHGNYVVSKTVRVPPDIRITGEIWPVIMAKGAAFQDQMHPQPVWQVGQPGDRGTVELSDLVFTTAGPQPGAILMEWNVAGAPGAVGLWDVHFRIGGFAGTELQSDTCRKTPGVKTEARAECTAAFLLFHATASGTPYVENCWFWVADHELDLADHAQINIYNGRGVLIESTGGSWWYGTASEHNVLYNYQLGRARNVYMSAIQTETAYFQSNPDATTPFVVQKRYYDPNFKICKDGDGAPCKKTWGVKINRSKDVLIYGAGLYSFFENYNQQCVADNNCQAHMVHIRKSSGITLNGLSTKASVSMVTVEGEVQALDADNRSNFCATLAQWRQE